MGMSCRATVCAIERFLSCPRSTAGHRGWGRTRSRHERVFPVRSGPSKMLRLPIVGADEGRVWQTRLMQGRPVGRAFVDGQLLKVSGHPAAIASGANPNFNGPSRGNRPPSEDNGARPTQWACSLLPSYGVGSGEDGDGGLGYTVEKTRVRPARPSASSPRNTANSRAASWLASAAGSMSCPR